MDDVTESLQMLEKQNEEKARRLDELRKKQVEDMKNRINEKTRPGALSAGQRMGQRGWMVG